MKLNILSGTLISVPPSYAPLWVKSNYSFLEGASHPEELVDQAARLGLPALALCDRDGVYGTVRAHMQAKKTGLRLIYGAQVSLGGLDQVPALGRGKEPVALQQAVVLAQSRKGYGRLCQLLSLGRQRCAKGYSLLTADELAHAGQQGGLLVLCPTPSLLRALAPHFGDRCYGMCLRHRQAQDQRQERTMRELCKSMKVSAVAANEVLYHHTSRRRLQDVLTCIRYTKAFNEIGQRLRPNAEHDLKSPYAMAELFADAPALLERSLEVVERCHFSLDDLNYRYPGEKLPEGDSEKSWLRKVTFEGALERYGELIPSEVRAQLERELNLIEELDYGGYFLTMWEIVQFCRREHILCQGRGSAANSAVCFCLGITAVDPVRMDLLFERFLSRERAEPPDIDIDIEHERREEVIQWIYDRYGRRHAAMVANIIRYRPRSAVRDIGKTLAIPEVALDRLAKLLGHYGSKIEGTLLRDAGLDPEHDAHRHLLELAGQILDFPRHLSIHPGGFILGSDPVDTMVPIEPATMEARTVIQWDKYDVEDLGLFKVDILGLGALTHIRKTLKLLRDHEDLDLQLRTIPAEDPATYRRLSRGDTVGVFQVESRAQMAMLPRLKPKNFYDLVIEIAIVRPGPIQGDMVHPYLRRRSGQEDAVYPHPALERVLGKTLGVPIFQEQVMKLAVAVAGYTPGEADQLRRDMAAWRSSGRIEKHRERLISRMVENGIDADFAERVFAQIRGFGEYGFPESHAASFALIAYATAYLREHHPAAFACGLLNAQPMGFYAASTIVEDAKRLGVELRPIDLRHSAWDCTLEPNSSPTLHALRMGFRYVKGVGDNERERIERACQSGPFLDLDDFVRRTRLGRRPLTQLAEAGVFDTLVGSPARRREALWAVRGLFNAREDKLALPQTGNAKGPRFARLRREEAILWDYRTSHHSTHGHPMLCLRQELDRQKIPDAQTLNRLPDGRRSKYVGLVICRQRPGTASGVTFYTLEDESGLVNLVVWSSIFERHAILARTASILGVTGKIQAVDGVIHLVADELWEPRFTIAPEGTKSRDFH